MQSVLSNLTLYKLCNISPGGNRGWVELLTEELAIWKESDIDNPVREKLFSWE